MRKASLLPALGAGFGLIRRAPMSILVWGLVAFALALIPMLLLLAVAGPQVFASDAPPSAAVLLLQPVQWLISLFSAALFYSAVYRAVLRPQDKGFAYLKVGADEFHVGVTIIILWILGVVCLLGLGAVFALPLIFAGVAGNPGALAVILLLFFVAFIGLLVPAVRLGMALPMTFAERRIRIFEAWAFTKGYTGALVGMALLQLLMMIVLYFAFVIVVVGMVVGTLGFAGMGDEAALEAFMQNPSNLTAIIPAIVAFGLLILVVSFVITPILLAPWARAYQLIAEAKGDNSEVFA